MVTHSHLHRGRVSAVRALLATGQYDEPGRLDRALVGLEQDLADETYPRRRAREIVMEDEDYDRALRRIVCEGLARDESAAEMLLREGL